MSATEINSIYVVQMQILGLDDYPFPSKEKLRSVWHSIFNSKTCFTNNLSLIRTSPWIPLVRSVPFIRGLGSCCFTGRSANLGGGHEAASNIEYNMKQGVENVAEDQEWRYDEKDYDSKLFQEFLNDHPMDDFFHRQYFFDKELYDEYFGGYPSFGYDPILEDQRMNYLYFEISRPLFLKAETNDAVYAQGRVFTHIYPSGYIALCLAVTLTWKDKRGSDEIRQLIQETRPWRLSNRWVWSSRIGKGNLFEIVGLIKNNICKSVYKDTSMHLQEGSWQTIVKITASEEGKQLASQILQIRATHEILDIKAGFDFLQCWLVVSKQGLAFISHPEYKSKTSDHIFWGKLLVLAEFVAYKQHIYKNYENLLRNQISTLKASRLSIKQKIEKGGLLNLSVYDANIPYFLSALDGHIRFASPFHRRIYSTISSGTNFNSQRDDLLKLLEKWEEEVERWEPGFVIIWRRLLSPLRSIIKLPL